MMGNFLFEGHVAVATSFGQQKINLTFILLLFMSFTKVPPILSQQSKIDIPFTSVHLLSVVSNSSEVYSVIKVDCFGKKA